MKQKYSIKVENNVIFETSDLETFNVEANRLKNRGTGRTTRLLFQAIGSSCDKVMIVGETRPLITQHLILTLCDIFDKLEFDFKLIKTQLTVEQFGKKYIFITKEQYRDECFWRGKNHDDYDIFFDSAY